MQVIGFVTNRRGKQFNLWVCSGACLEETLTELVRGGSVVDNEGFLGGISLLDFAKKRALLVQAEHFAMAERLEDAAQTFERAGMWEEAGKMRRRNRQQTITQVHIDLNQLVSQLRNGGLTATYVCPTCHGQIEISGESDASSLYTCSYCHSVIQVTDLANVIGKVLER